MGQMLLANNSRGGKKNRCSDKAVSNRAGEEGEKCVAGSIDERRAGGQGSS